MIALRKLGALAKNLQRPVMMPFSDNWKNRDEAAEKVYISQTEKDTLKRLLKKVEKEKHQQESNMEQFQRKLTQIMSRYKLSNQSLAAEIIALHNKMNS